MREASHKCVAEDVYAETDRQLDKWGIQSHPDGTGSHFLIRAEVARNHCNQAAKQGRVTWQHILSEEVYEALAESDPDKLVAELTQVAAVCVSWIADVQSRADKE